MHYQLKSFFHRLLYGIIFLILLNQCGGESSQPSIPTFDFGGKYNSLVKKNYRRYSYSYKKKRYKFKKRDLITPTDLKNLGTYYKVYYYKGSNKIARIDDIQSYQTVRSTLFFLNKKNKLSRSESYLTDKRIDMIGKYKKGILISRKKLTYRGKVRYVSKIKYLKKGIEEKWFTLHKKLAHVIFYNRFNKPVRYANYKKKLLDTIVDFRYNENGQLVGEKYYDARRNPLKSSVFAYNKKGNLHLVYTYVDGKLSFMTEFNEQGREIRSEKYDKNEMIISYAKITYDGPSKEEKWYDNFDQLITLSRFTPDKKLKVYYKYVNGKEVYSEEHDFKDGILERTNFYSFGKLSKRHIYNSKGVLKRDEKFRDGDLLFYSIYQYNKLGQIAVATQHNGNDKILGVWKYFYNKRQQVKKEEFYKRNKLISKNLYSYDKSGKKRIIKLFRKGKLINLKHYNKRGRLTKVENYNKGKRVNSIVLRYSRKGKVYQEKHYNRVNELERTLTFNYNKKGQKIQENGYDRRKQYLGSIRYFYDNQGRLIKEKRYNWLKQLYETVHYDALGRTTHTENHSIQR